MTKSFSWKLPLVYSATTECASRRFEFPLPTDQRFVELLLPPTQLLLLLLLLQVSQKCLPTSNHTHSRLLAAALGSAYERTCAVCNATTVSPPTGSHAAGGSAGLANDCFMNDWPEQNCN